MEEVVINPNIELPELTQDWETLWEGTNRTLCTRTQKKGALTLQETDPVLPVGVREFPAWVGGGLLQGSGHGL